MKPPPTPYFSDNPVVKNAGDPDKYVEITVSVPAVLESWRLSLFSYEWLDREGRIKATEYLSAGERHKRLNTETLLKAGQALVKPVLGIGLLDNIEIGSGRAEFLTLAAWGVSELPVHIPRSNLPEFKNFIVKYTGRAQERGNVLFYILIAVALLAALSYAVSQSGRGNIQQLSEEKSKLYASEILEYANTLNNATAQLRLRGCKDTQLSFENDVKPGYVNSSSPADHSCDIFQHEGGGVHWKTMAVELLGDHPTLSAVKGDVTIGGNMRIEDVNTSDADLIMIVSLIQKDVCMKINEFTRVANDAGDAPLTVVNGALTPFTGIYEDSSPGEIGVNDTKFSQKKAGCYRLDVSGQPAYFFYKVLLPR